MEEAKNERPGIYGRTARDWVERTCKQPLRWRCDTDGDIKLGCSACLA